MKKFIGLFLLVFAALVFASCTQVAASETSYLAIDINPSVELVLDENDKVQYANALNEDGEVLLAELDVLGMDVEKAMDLIIAEATDLGFIDPEGETTVSVTTVNDKEDVEENLQKKAKAAVEKAFADRGMKGFAKVNNMTPEMIAEAEALGISPAKLRLVKQAMVLDPELTQEEAIAMKVSDLVHLVKKNGNLIKDMAKDVKSQFNEQREAIRAEYADRIADLKTQMEAKQAEIDAAVDEEAKAASTSELEDLQDQLAAIEKEIAARVKELRNSFQDQIDDLKEQRKNERKVRIEEHKEKVEAFKDQVKKNREKIREAVEKWQQEREKQ